MRTPERKYTNVTVMLEPGQIDWLDSMAARNKFGITNRSAVMRFILDHVADIVSDMNMDVHVEKDVV